MATLKNRFDEAKRHINAGEYAQARALLKQIKHPTARAWEKKLDALDVPEPDLIIESTPPKPGRSNTRLLLLIALVLVFVVILVVLRINFQNGYNEAMGALSP